MCDDKQKTENTVHGQDLASAASPASLDVLPAHKSLAWSCPVVVTAPG